jgi:hypothetical protein
MRRAVARGDGRVDGVMWQRECRCQVGVPELSGADDRSSVEASRREGGAVESEGRRIKNKGMTKVDSRQRGRGGEHEDERERGR